MQQVAIDMQRHELQLSTEHEVGRLAWGTGNAAEHANQAKPTLSPTLSLQVKKTCGTPNLLPSLTAGETQPLPQHVSIKWAMSPEAGILHFLSTIQKSKDFFTNIVFK